MADNPFLAAGMIEDPRLFVGRKDELNAIASRMKGDQPTSINAVRPYPYICRILISNWHKTLLGFAVTQPNLLFCLTQAY